MDLFYVWCDLPVYCKAVTRRYDTSREVAGSSADEVFEFFNLSKPFSRTVVLGLSKPLRAMSTRSLSEGEARPAHKAKNLSAICKPTV
jgi:hypothetical protein